MQPIASIGLARGFADQSAFDRKCKATTGTTPRRYRKPILEPEA
ncbi:MAG: AraC family transcriptional regulator, partial [Rhodanobacter sp.]